MKDEGIPFSFFLGGGDGFDPVIKDIKEKE